MPVNLPAPHVADLLPIDGVRIGVTQAGVRKAGRKDVTVWLLDEGTHVGGVFTQNRFCAAPVQVCREHLQAGAGVRAMVINTGNANAGTGEDGLRRARETCEALAAQLGLKPQQVLPFSPASSWSHCRTSASWRACPLPSRLRVRRARPSSGPTRPRAS